MPDFNIDLLRPEDTVIETLGEPTHHSPLAGHFIDEDDSIFVEVYKKYRHRLDENGEEIPPVFFEHAGPREKLFFDPTKTKCAIVTCGGLCPGLNNVIRAIVLECHHNYNVPAVLGIRYGLAGFIPSYGHDVINLKPETVTSIHQFGGTMLGTSRGPQSAEEIVDSLERMNISILFTIGGDGTMRASQTIREEISRRGLRKVVVGVPKTIDNDINFVARSFGFETAVDKVTEAIRCAHTEATGAPNGIGLVKVMGRDSGYIAAEATLALRDVNFVLVPEVKFNLHGENGFLTSLENRLRDRGHAVVVVAEGAGQHLLLGDRERDLSGNLLLGDIAGLLKREIQTHLSERDLDFTLKYIDPSYIIRSVPANSNDRVYCGFLGSHSVHAAMSGRTGMVVSQWNGRFVHIPFHLVTRKRKKLNTSSNYWRAVVESTGQPRCLCM